MGRDARFYGYSPFIYAFQKTNVALTGNGTLDGQAKETWAKWADDDDADKDLNREMNQTRVPLENRLFGEGLKLRPPMIQFYECENILVEEVRIIDSPFLCVHAVFPQNITVREITFTAMNPNNDGLDIDSRENVYIHDIVLANDDDNVVIKSNRAAEGRDLCIPTRNVYVRDCVFNAYAEVAIGSEISSSIYNIFVEDSYAESKCKRGLNIKGNRDWGGGLTSDSVMSILGMPPMRCL